MDLRIKEIDKRLTELLAQGTEKEGLLYEAAHYLLLAPGKRIRPLIVASITEMLGGNVKEAITAGAALEMIHTYSLIHDDLPCMDDDDMRRGKPTMHKVYGEATAILTGDFLLTFAFEVLSHHTNLHPAQKVALITALAQGAGGNGMVAGQLLDLEMTGSTIEKIHALKTAALFKAAFTFAAIISNQTPSFVAEIGEWGNQFGLLFQLVDDIQDDDHPTGLEEAEAKAEKIAQTLRGKAESYPFDSQILTSLIDTIFPSTHLTLSSKL